MLRRRRVLLMQIEHPTDRDAAAVEALLASAGLPLEGAREALGRGVVGRVGGRVVAAAGVERYGDAGLLRSVVVDASARGAGLGREIVAAAEARARTEGISELFLLTETAAAWFPRLGYEVVERSAAAARVGASVEFTTVCRDTGVPMRKRLR